ncbi:hypothetical protein [Nocardia nova]|uniref:hypothetical protein n=1 Tax=Nocardia nova TaxID=37330 RepID=UPI0025B10E48|nr:hypothetical protein [Nocardia nova]
MHQVEEIAATGTSPVRSARALHFHDVGSGAAQQVRAQGARPQRGQIDDNRLGSAMLPKAAWPHDDSAPTTMSELFVLRHSGGVGDRRGGDS